MPLRGYSCLDLALLCYSSIISPSGKNVLNMPSAERILFDPSILQAVRSGTHLRLYQGNDSLIVSTNSALYSVCSHTPSSSTMALFRLGSLLCENRGRCETHGLMIDSLQWRI